MAEPTAAGQENTPAAPEQAVPARSSSSLVVRLAALLFVVAVILAECLITYVVLTRSSDNSAEAKPAASQESAKGESGHGQPGSSKGHGQVPSAKGQHGAKAGSEDASKEGAHPAITSDQLEVDLERFNVTAHQPASSTTVRIDFHLFGIIAAQDKEEFENLMKINQHRFREQVLVTVRSAEGADLADAGLGLIKRQISEKTNALLGKPLLKAVIVSDFSYMEQ